jgi:hypothetical protein
MPARLLMSGATRCGPAALHVKHIVVGQMAHLQRMTTSLIELDRLGPIIKLSQDDPFLTNQPTKICLSILVLARLRSLRGVFLVYDILGCAQPLESGCTIVPIDSADAAFCFANHLISYTFSI